MIAGFALTGLFVIIVFIAVNALYVAAEFAAVAVRRSQIRERAESGDRAASRLLPILDTPRLLDEYIAACQIGITFSSLALGAYAQIVYTRPLSDALARFFGLDLTLSVSSAVVTILATLTAAQVILGELLPKSFALRFPLATAIGTVRPMRYSLVLFRPAISLLNGSGLLLLRLVGFQPKGHQGGYSPEDIEMVFAEGRAAGLLNRKEYRRLRQGLGLSKRRVHHIMVPRLKISSIDAALPLDQFLRAVVASPYTRLPVYRGTVDNIVGYVHTKKVVAKYLDNSLRSIDDVILPVAFVPETLPVVRLLEVLRREHSHLALVYDEYGALLGLLTLDDVLSELLGVVPDEFKGGVREPERLADGRVRLPGEMAKHLAYLWTGTEWTGDAQTVSGHIIHTLGRLPKKGERVTIDGATIEIEQTASHRITSVLLLPKDSPKVTNP